MRGAAWIVEHTDKDRRPRFCSSWVILLLLGLLTSAAEGAKGPAPIKRSMAAIAPTKPDTSAPPAQPPAASSSAAAQARLLEVRRSWMYHDLWRTSRQSPHPSNKHEQLDRLCDRLAHRLRSAEDRLYPPTAPSTSETPIQAATDGGQPRRRPPRVVFRSVRLTLIGSLFLGQPSHVTSSTRHSDLDGTLLHFSGTLFEEGYEVKDGLPPSFEPLSPPVIRAHDPKAEPPQYVLLRCVVVCCAVIVL